MPLNTNSAPKAPVASAANGAKTVSKVPTAGKSTGPLENYEDLILKAQNLTLQRDRLQASQILVRAIQRENHTSLAYREMTKALSELSGVFYTEKAQSVFSVGEAAVENRPKDAVDSFQEALRLEDGNVSILKALARVQLTLADCEKAEATVRSAEAIDPYSSELKLLGLQALACAKSFDQVLDGLESSEAEPEETFVRNLRTGLQIQALLAVKPKADLKKVKTLLTGWESSSSDYPEVHYWKWELSKANGSSDRTAAVKYSQTCQNLTPRKRKSYSLDVNLCKWKDVVDIYLKESGLSSTPKPPAS